MLGGRSFFFSNNSISVSMIAKENWQNFWVGHFGPNLTNEDQFKAFKEAVRGSAQLSVRKTWTSVSIITNV